MKRNLFLLGVFILLALSACTKTEQIELFPERQQINRISESFFNEILVGDPRLKTIPFYIRSHNYFSAYIKLSRVLSKIPYFIERFENFRYDFDSLIEKYTALREGLSIDGYMKQIGAAQLKRHQLFVLLCYDLYHQYSLNKLSGSTAFRQWNILMQMINDVLKAAETRWENHLILTIASELFFLKKRELIIKSRKQHQNRMLKQKIKMNRENKLFALFIKPYS